MNKHTLSKTIDRHLRPPIGQRSPRQRKGAILLFCAWMAFASIGQAQIGEWSILNSKSTNNSSPLGAFGKALSCATIENADQLLEMAIRSATPELSVWTALDGLGTMAECATHLKGARSRYAKLMGRNFEEKVRVHLVRAPHLFTNHDLARSMPKMSKAIPGHFNTRGHGIDILSTDQRGRLWVIEAKHHNRLTTGFNPHPVKYAGNETQMSRAWRQKAAENFIDSEDGVSRARDLLEMPGASDKQIRTEFLRRLENHRPAVIHNTGPYFELPRETGMRWPDDVWETKIPAESAQGLLKYLG